MRKLQRKKLNRYPICNHSTAVVLLYCVFEKNEENSLNLLELIRSVANTL